jgi:hypothetical protein
MKNLTDILSTIASPKPYKPKPKVKPIVKESIKKEKEKEKKKGLGIWGMALPIEKNPDAYTIKESKKKIKKPVVKEKNKAKIVAVVKTKEIKPTVKKNEKENKPVIKTKVLPIIKESIVKENKAVVKKPIKKESIIKEKKEENKLVKSEDFPITIENPAKVRHPQKSFTSEQLFVIPKRSVAEEMVYVKREIKRLIEDSKVEYPIGVLKEIVSKLILKKNELKK